MKIREALKLAPLQKYITALDTFVKCFTMVTATATDIEIVADTSFSAEIRKADEAWMVCMAYSYFMLGIGIVSCNSLLNSSEK